MSLFNYLKSKTYSYSFLLIILCFISFIPPKTASAGAVVWDPGNFAPNWTTGVASGFLVTKEFGLDALAWFAANLVMKKMVAQTVNWINNGFKGNPAYVTDPSQFFLDVGDETASHVLSSTNLNQLCSPFKADVRLALVKNYLSETSNQIYSCSLSILKNNYDAFIQDFDQGGWDGWFELTQNSQNNPYGAYLDAQNQLSIEVGTTRSKYQQQLAQGRGFLSFERCKAGTENPAIKGDCAPANREVVTPGAVIEQQLEGVLSIGNNRLIQADEIDEVITALLNQLISKVIGGSGDGLRGTSENTTGPSFTGSIVNESEGGSSRNEVTCTTNANGVADCVMNEPPPPPPPGVPETQVTCVTDSSGLMTCTIPQVNNGGTGGGTTGGGNTMCGAGNDGGTTVPPPIASDFSNVVIDGNNADISGWPISNSVTLNSVTFPNGTNPTGTFCLNHQMPWPWPAQSTFAPNVPANGWVFVWRGGVWHAATFEYYYDVGGEAQCRDMESVWSNNQIGGNFGLFSPKPGETYGWMLSGIARNSIPQGTANERSNIVMQTWQGATCTGPSGGGTGGGGTGGGGTTSGPPVINTVTPNNPTTGVTFVTITGTNLTSIVQFYSTNGSKSSVVGSINSTATQVTVMVPSDVPPGTTEVKIYKNANTISNGVYINVLVNPAAGGATIAAQKNIGPGISPDVLVLSNKVWVVNGSPSTFNLTLYEMDLNLNILSTQIISGSASHSFPRVTSFNGIIWVAYKTNEPEVAHLWRSDTGVSETLGPAIGNEPVAVGFGKIAWQDGIANRVLVRNLTGGPTVDAGPTSATGINRVNANNSVLLVENYLTNGWGVRPYDAGNMTIAENPNGNPNLGLIAKWADGSVLNIWSTEETFTPHASVNGPNYGIITWGAPGVRIGIINKP